MASSLVFLAYEFEFQISNFVSFKLLVSLSHSPIYSLAHSRFIRLNIPFWPIIIIGILTKSIVERSFAWWEINEMKWIECHPFECVFFEYYFILFQMFFLCVCSACLFAAGWLFISMVPVMVCVCVRTGGGGHSGGRHQTSGWTILQVHGFVHLKLQF